MASDTFEEFLLQLDRQMGQKTEKSCSSLMNVLHTQDLPHCSEKYYSYIFPPNCTSHLQPVDMGVIHAFKCQYRKQFIQNATAMIKRELVMQDHLSFEGEEKQEEEKEMEDELIENKVSFFWNSKQCNRHTPTRT
jgi:hypothetical protein